MQQAEVDGLSGTVVQRADLGIPEIPGIGGEDSSELTSLISGTHTLRVRYAGPDKARLAVHGTYGETDVFVNCRDVWVWSSRDQKATHRTLPAERGKDRADTSDQPVDVPKTPEEAAKKVLDALTPTTTVSTDSAVEVAGHDAYELVLEPNDESLIKQVRIAVDAGHQAAAARPGLCREQETRLRGRLHRRELHPPRGPGVRVQAAARHRGDRGDHPGAQGADRRATQAGQGEGRSVEGADQDRRDRLVRGRGDQARRRLRPGIRSAAGLPEPAPARSTATGARDGCSPGRRSRRCSPTTDGWPSVRSNPTCSIGPSARWGTYPRSSVPG